MDKTILVEYVDMKEEIKDLRKRIQEDEKKLEQLNNSIVTDSVTCGKKGKRPLRTVKIQGKPTMAMERIEKALKKKRKQMELFELELLEMQTRVEEYIEQIEKSALRTMFRFCFLDGLSYPKVAIQMNRLYPQRKVKYTDENIKKRIQRFFENVPQCPDKT